MTIPSSSPETSSLKEPVTDKDSKPQSCIEEEIAAEMDCRSLKYRYGWPILPPLPVRTIEKDVAQSIPNSSEHVTSAQRILDAEGIKTEVSFVYRMPRSAHKAEMQDYLTLLVATDTEAHAADRFHNVVIKLRLHVMNIPETADTKIEIIDYRAKIDLVCGSTSGPLAERIDEIWPTPLVKLISTATADDLNWWKTVIPALREIVVSLELEFDIDFEVLACVSIYGNPIDDEF
ncbi:hypothetical protein TUN205_03641 [Pyrenophora tritici-repentis]|nr:hypothetical protein TUN205_03641 [Pyrenophora tritici-repentis]